MLFSTKTYPLSKEGWQQAKLDLKKEKIDLAVEVAFWGLIIGFMLNQTNGYEKLLKILASTTGKKLARWF